VSTGKPAGHGPETAVGPAPPAARRPARRFGPALLADLDRARGDAPDPREPIALPPTFEQRIELFTRADNAEQLMAGARVLIARLLAWARGAACASGSLHAAHAHEERRDAVSHSELAIGLAEASADAAHLQALLGERLARTPLVAPALELSCSAMRCCRRAFPTASCLPPAATSAKG
jgi:protein ImuB